MIFIGNGHHHNKEVCFFKSRCLLILENIYYPCVKYFAGNVTQICINSSNNTEK